MLNNIFPHYFINGRILQKRKVTEHKMFFFIFWTVFFWNISNSKKNWSRYQKMSIDLHVKYPLFFPNLMKIEFSWQIFEKCSNTKFHDKNISLRKTTFRSDPSGRDWTSDKPDAEIATWQQTTLTKDSLTCWSLCNISSHTSLSLGSLVQTQFVAIFQSHSSSYLRAFHTVYPSEICMLFLECDWNA
jgi:hypothetical protein